jgi:hypothetical protein
MISYLCREFWQLRPSTSHLLSLQGTVTIETFNLWPRFFAGNCDSCLRLLTSDLLPLQEMWQLKPSTSDLLSLQGTVTVAWGHGPLTSYLCRELWQLPEVADLWPLTFAGNCDSCLRLLTSDLFPLQELWQLRPSTSDLLSLQGTVTVAWGCWPLTTYLCRNCDNWSRQPLTSFLCRELWQSPEVADLWPITFAGTVAIRTFNLWPRFFAGNCDSCLRPQTSDLLSLRGNFTVAWGCWPLTSYLCRNCDISDLQPLTSFLCRNCDNWGRQPLTSFVCRELWQLPEAAHWGWLHGFRQGFPQGVLQVRPKSAKLLLITDFLCWYILYVDCHLKGVHSARKSWKESSSPKTRIHTVPSASRYITIIISPIVILRCY